MEHTADEQRNGDSRSRGWCFTSNNPTEEDEHRIFDLAHHARYVVAGRETAPTTGTPHLQGFVYFDNPRRFSGVRKLLPPGTHIEPKSIRSTFLECSDYCKKNGDFFEAGELPMDDDEKGEEGKKSALERWELALDGRFKELPPEHYTRYQAIYYKFRTVNDRELLDNIWVCGRSGCGKSRWVRETYGPGTLWGGELGFYSKGINKWWDGYNDEFVVLIEDYEPKHSEFLSYYLKIWADHYAFNAEIKGGMIKIRPRTFIITSQYSIEECFQSPQDRAAMNRRFKIRKLAELESEQPYTPNFNHN